KWRPIVLFHVLSAVHGDAERHRRHLHSQPVLSRGTAAPSSEPLYRALLTKPVRMTPASPAPARHLLAFPPRFRKTDRDRLLAALHLAAAAAARGAALVAVHLALHVALRTARITSSSARLGHPKFSSWIGRNRRIDASLCRHAQTPQIARQR